MLLLNPKEEAQLPLFFCLKILISKTCKTKIEYIAIKRGRVCHANCINPKTQGGFMQTYNNQETVYLQLQNELSSFGLRPEEWSLHSRSHSLFEIKNIYSKNFVFSGQVEKTSGRPRWKMISLKSI